MIYKVDVICIIDEFILKVVINDTVYYREIKEEWKGTTRKVFFLTWLYPSSKEHCYKHIQTIYRLTCMKPCTHAWKVEGASG